MEDFKKLFDIYISDEEIENPNWKDKSRVHNWKDYVDDGVKKKWSELTFREKIIIYSFADRLASNEEWD